MDLLDKSETTYWLDGGLGVDVLTGKQLSEMTLEELNRYTDFAKGKSNNNQ